MSMAERKKLHRFNEFSCRTLLNAVRCLYVRNARSSVTLGVASSVANEVTMTIAGLSRGIEPRLYGHI